MDCPTCDAKLSITHRENIEIDYCPECRGIWLDRGELDKLIERSSRHSDERVDRRDRDHQRRDRDYDRREYKYKKRKSWLSELLDFD
ncbi:MAG: zf-TFIIB domain-containing protein [Aureliella sp.]